MWKPGPEARCDPRVLNAMGPSEIEQLMEIKLAIIDDDKDYLTVFSEYASQVLGFARPASYTQGEALLRALARVQFDVILVDLVLGRSSGCSLIQEIKRIHTDARVLVLSAHSDDFLIAEALSQGADGYLLKTQPLKEVLAAVQDYYSGGVAMEPSVLRKVLSRLRKASNFEMSIGSLTPRESTILKQLATGRAYKEIALSLNLSPQTVYSHAKRLFKKLGVKSQTEAVARYLGTGTSASPRLSESKSCRCEPLVAL
jgi:DNA-binding NarL/FixJ family response regulator